MSSAPVLIHGYNQEARYWDLDNDQSQYSEELGLIQQMPDIVLRVHRAVESMQTMINLYKEKMDFATNHLIER